MYKKITLIFCKPPGYKHKFLLIMKLTTLFILAAFLQVSAATFAQKVTYKSNKATFEQMIKEIRKQTGYNILTTASKIDKIPAKAVDFKDAPIQEVLQVFLADQPLTFVIDGQTIVIKEKEQKTTEQYVAPTPPVTVTGKVANELGEPMPGVTIKQKTNPANGTVADAKGNYTLIVPDDKTLIVFSYIGYETQELAAKDIVAGSVITLKPEAQNLHEVVVNNGYYSTKQRLSTGDVSIVSSKELEEQPITDPIVMMEGKVPGLYISQASGIPGAYSKINIMGQNSIQNGNDPLYVIDGSPYSSISPTSPFVAGAQGTSNPNGHNTQGSGTSPFELLDPANIESIEVLKDADATAIYGSRGANGVILITTKKGKPGDTRVSFNISQGNGQVTRMMPLMNTQQYLGMREQALRNDGSSPSFNDGDYDIVSWDTTRYTNWEKALIGNTAHYTNANLTLSGGNSNTQFLLGGTFNKQSTVYPGDYADNKSSGYVNVSHHSTNQRFTAQLNVSYTYDYNNEPSIDLTSTALGLPPDLPPLYNSDGTRNWAVYNGSYTSQNPLNYEAQTYWIKTNNLTTSLSLGYQLLPGLKLQSNFGYNNQISNQTLLTPLTYLLPFITDPTQRSNNSATDQLNSWSIEPQLNFERKIGRGQLSALIGTSFQSQSQNDLGYNASGFNSDAQIVNPSVATSLFLSAYDALYRYNAIYGRLGYTWDDTYLLNITARRDGSSRFGPDKQWGNFGSIGAGWIFSKEKFISNNLSWLSFGKLRASYGITGNDQIGDYQYLSTYTGNNSSYLGQTILGPTALTNPYYSWEHVKKMQIGTDIGFLKDRINVTATWYRNRDDDQLVGYVLPEITGFTSVQANLPASVQNSGWEFTLNTQNITSNQFRWTSAFNLTLPQNKLLAFPNIQSSSYATRFSVGHSLFSQLVYSYTGVNPQTGVYTFTTQNSDGLPSSSDRIWSQPITQTAYGSFTNSFSYGGFRLDVMLYFVKQLGYNYLNYVIPPGFIGNNNGNEPIYLLNAWQVPGDHSSVGKYTETGGPAYTAFSDLQTSTASISDASFIRLRNVSLGYNVPQTLIKKASLQSARIYLNAENLFTITGYKGVDPETMGNGLPPLRIITLGLQGTF